MESAASVNFLNTVLTVNFNFSFVDISYNKVLAIVDIQISYYMNDNIKLNLKNKELENNSLKCFITCKQLLLTKVGHHIFSHDGFKPTKLKFLPKCVLIIL